MPSPIIYICEDDLMLGKDIQSLLNQEGYQSSWFYDGTSLGEGISQQLPDLLLMDVQLPGEDGFVLAQRYGTAIPSLRIIMMSVRNDESMRANGFNAGAMMYLPKPFEPAALLACLQGLFGHKLPQCTAVLQLSTSSLVIGARQVRLTQGELAIVRQLALTGGVVEYYLLIEALELQQSEVSKASLEVFVSRLRKKLKSMFDVGEIEIKSKYKVGYFLVGKLVLET